MAIKDYSTTPDMNTMISGINIAEGCPPSGINNAIRQLMADVKAESEATQAAQAAKDAQQDAAIAAQAAKDAQQDAAIATKLSTSGGTMTGTFVSPQATDTFLRKENDSGAVVISGGSGYSGGGVLILRGKDSSGNDAGNFEIRTNDGTNSGALKAWANGKFTWKGLNILVLTASWSDDNGNFYRKYSDGWIEQGGTVATTDNFGGSDITFRLPFADTYYAFSVVGANNSQWMARTAITYRNKSATGITIDAHSYGEDSGRFRGCTWYACGY